MKDKLVDRQRELSELNSLLEAPGARLVGVSGRRRMGKTTLLERWAQGSGLPALLWTATKKLAPLQLQSFSQAIYRLEHSRPAPNAAYSYPDWDAAFEDLARIGSKGPRRIAVLDEFPYAVSADPSLPSVLQRAWDHALKRSNLVMVLCGSQVGMMNNLFHSDAPLFQRLQGPMRIAPLPFACVGDFLPGYLFEDRLAAYAAFGGVPAYLELLDARKPVLENIRYHVFSSFGIFATEPEQLIGEQVSEVGTYMSILDAVANGARTPSEIAARAGIKATTNPGPYLSRLVEMDYLRNEYPLTLPPQRRERSKQAHYLLTDPMLQFYFRFVEKNRSALAQEFYNTFETRLNEGLSSFIGRNAFEEVCRQWLREQARIGQTPFLLEDVGTAWSAKIGQAVQADVVGISWRERRILIGEAKWTDSMVGPEVVDKLLNQTSPRVLALLPGRESGEPEWKASHILFTRRGFSKEAYKAARKAGVILVTVDPIEDELKFL